MLRTFLKAKIQRARVTETNLYYEGSITIDAQLMQAADILPGEKVEVLNFNNGQRLETYAIKGKPGSGSICLNGPASRSASIGDEVAIVSYVLVDEQEAKSITPKIISVNERNQIKD
ncbi:MAG: aspartate 1-decarboxylase [Candidatus Omnitrophica bacterium]|nr:aspartate 1-decarboxylase [Candidatus Omnitrophota bacterium]MBU4345949.1 aspartate 1-decarboxylase [Candidatus Omnitrophota bacterium]MBU4472695.1 aspartate 1-decarboxylase [Candidatus Omnitrophota bacterium]MCG2705977.1 aspartate 1-decarboxylase [Candidatus Omnitrophota bacterium]